MFLNSDKTFNYETKFLVPVSQREKFMPDLVKQKNLKCSLQSPEPVIPGSLVLQNSLLLHPPIITHLAHCGDAQSPCSSDKIYF